MKKTNIPPFIDRILFYIIAFFTGIVVLPAWGTSHVDIRKELKEYGKYFTSI